MKENKIGTRIRKLRVSKDLTQDNMAMDLGITAGAYAKIERGETDPSATRLLKIAEILEVDVTTFFKDNIPAAKFEDPGNQYGFATKQDVEKLTHLIQQMNRDIEKLKSQRTSKRKTTPKKKTS